MTPLTGFFQAPRFAVVCCPLSSTLTSLTNYVKINHDNEVLRVKKKFLFICFVSALNVFDVMLLPCGTFRTDICPKPPISTFLACVWIIETCRNEKQIPHAFELKNIPIVNFWIFQLHSTKVGFACFHFHVLDGKLPIKMTSIQVPSMMDSCQIFRSMQTISQTIALIHVAEYPVRNIFSARAPGAPDSIKYGLTAVRIQDGM